MFRGSKELLGAVAIMLMSGPAWTAENADVGSALASDVTPASAEQAQPANAKIVDFGTPMAPEALDQHRAGESKFQLNLMDVKASLEDNQAINTLNGSNFITGDAFAHASGLPVAVQNSGNNVIIQNAFILNLNVK